MQHPDEGTIHAWLDGALSLEEGRAIEEHAAGCAACAASIAEARGLIAGSSRILAALDAVPGGVLPSEATFDALGSDRARPARREWWRSVPLRAAAAIVLVGSVSWLATRSQNQHDVATAAVAPAAADTWSGIDTMAAPPTPSIVARKEVPGPTSVAAATTPPRRFAEPRPARPRPNEEVQPEAANVVAQSAQAADAAAASGAVAAAPPPSVALGSVTMGGVAQRPASGGAGMAVPGTRRDFAAAKRATLDRDSVRSPSIADEQRLPAAPLAKASMAATGAPAIAPAIAPLMPGRESLHRLTGCYTLEPVIQSVAGRDASSLAPLLPARIELRSEHADTNDPAVMMMRPAAGEALFPVTALASWKAVGENALELSVADGSRLVTATLTLAGDSVSGWARATENGQQTSVSTVRGRRTPCTGP